eukprot:SAG31_NODE_1870_length_7027_cov_6.614319_5_plen_153_part_00
MLQLDSGSAWHTLLATTSGRTACTANAMRARRRGCLQLVLLRLAEAMLRAAAAKPNIIFALGDDTGWHGVGWHQSEQCRSDPNCAMQTPHMDAALKEGVELDQHYTYRFCSPTRASLLASLRCLCLPQHLLPEPFWILNPSVFLRPEGCQST